MKDNYKPKKEFGVCGDCFKKFTAYCYTCEHEKKVKEEKCDCHKKFTAYCYTLIVLCGLLFFSFCIATIVCLGLIGII